MIKVLADASLPILTTCFPPPFALTVYQQAQEIPALLGGQQVLLCRSTLAVQAPLLQQQGLEFVATASSGVDHIDVEYLQQKNIAVLDAKGSNATSVANYVLATLAWLKVHRGVNPQRVGIIGCGATGSAVRHYLQALGLTVVAYDPLRPDFASCDFAQLYTCDLLCVHVNLHRGLPHPSWHLLDERFLKRLKENTAIINTSRGNVVDEQALLSLNKPLLYCSDVFANEPAIDPGVIAFSTLCTPHIAGHSIEAKENAVKMLSIKLHHAYQLPPPSFSTLVTKPVVLHLATWPQQLLSLYNPSLENQQLKASPSAKTFLALRKAHCTRHDWDLELDGLLLRTS